MNLDRPHLDLLEALDEFGTLSKAGEHLHLSASAASRRLREAQRRAGVDLVEAHGRGVRLTAAGRLLAEVASDTNRRLYEAQIAARWLAASHTSAVRIGVGFYDRVGWLLPPWHRQPYEITRSGSTKAIDALKQPRVDLAVGVSAGHESIGHTLADDELVLVANPEVASQITTEVGTHATPEIVTRYDYVTYELDPSAGYQFERFFLPARCYPTTIALVESLLAMVDVVTEGGAVTIQPRRIVAELHHPALRTIPLTIRVPVRWFVVRSDRANEIADEYFDDLVQRALASNSGTADQSASGPA